MDFFFRKLTKIAQPLGLPRMIRLSWAILHNKWGHSARQTKPFSNKKILTFGSNPFPFENTACVPAPATTCSDFFGVTMRILSHTQVTIVSRFFSLSSYHLARIYSCASASLLSKKLVRRETPVRHTSLLVTA